MDRIHKSQICRLFFFAFLLWGFCPFFMACSNVQLEIYDVNSAVVFDYADENLFPSVRLSVFAETSEDERKVSQIGVTHLGSGQQWVCVSPRKISGGGNSVWAGYSNFVPATGESFPQGRYSLEYVDMAGESVQSSFSVVYPETLLRTTANDIATNFRNMEEWVALYDGAGKMIYFGQRRENWNGNQDIKFDYGHAEKIRICYRMNGGAVVCLLPQKDI